MNPEADIVYRHVILGTFQFLGFLFPINDIHRTTDSIALLGHSILATHPQNIFGNFCVMTFYFIQTTFDMMELFQNHSTSINHLLSGLGNIFMFVFYFVFLSLKAYIWL
jgi:hypothetical protein